MKTFPILYNVEITGIAAEGMAMAKADGKVLFVPFAASGDVLDVQIRCRRSNYMEGTIVRIVKASPLRNEPFCPHYGVCGGCKWQHLQYEQQLIAKHQQVQDQLLRIGKASPEHTLPIIPCEQTLQYRNKLEFTFSNRAWRTTPISDDAAPQSCLALGFHIPKRFDKVLDIQQCALQAEPSNAIRNAIRRFAVENGYTFYDQKQQCGLLRNLIIRIGHNSSSMHSRNHAHGAAITKMSDIMAARSDKLQDGYHGDSSTSVMDTPVPPSCDAHDYHHGHRMANISAIAPSTKEEGKYLPNTMDDRQEVMAAIVFSHYDEQMVMAMMRCVHAAFPALTSLQYVINSKANDSIHDCPAAVYAGRDYIVDTIGEYRFRIGLKSFFQTNTAQAQRLYDAAIGMAHLTGRENVYDLYCGAGTIGCCMSRSAAGVVGIDIIPQAIEDARANSLLNDLPNARFVCGDVKDMLGSDFINAYGAADIAVLDPPRAGLHPHVVKCLLEMLPPTLVYVSCNPAAMARDIAALGAAYDLRTVQAVDMFPHTQHVECVAALRLRT